jgi:hypothetical protein
MAIVVDLRADVRQVEKMLGGLRKDAPVVISRAINRTLTPLRATAAREIARDLKLPVNTARKAMTLRRATPFQLAGSVTASGRRIPLIEFGARQVAAGVSYDLGRGRQVAKGAFIPGARQGAPTRRAVFRRVARARLPLEFLRGPSIPKVFVQKKITAALRATSDARWPREVQAQLRFLISRLGAR